MKKENIYATKSQLLDLVTKIEFSEFKEEMRDFRYSTEKRFIAIDRRFDSIEELIRTSTGVLYDQFSHDLKLGMEYFQNIDNKKVDTKEFEALKIRVEQYIAQA